MPAYVENHIWAADFTELVQHGKKVYVATMLDLYTRRILGIQVAVRHREPRSPFRRFPTSLLHHPQPGSIPLPTTDTGSMTRWCH